MSRIEALEPTSLTLYCLGPTGTFTEEAGRKVVEKGLVRPEAGIVLLNSINDVFSYVTSGNSALGVVPIENATAGHVKDALRGLSRDNLRVAGELVLPITQSFFYQSLEEPRTVASKDSALGQCKKWLKQNFPQASLWEVESTALAVEMAANEPQIAAIGAPWAGSRWVEEGRLTRVDSVQDNPHNATRFILIAPSSHEAPPKTGRDKTTLLLTLEDKPGTLYSCLELFAENGINLSQIKSFLRNENDVQIFITLEGHQEDQNIAGALNGLAERTKNLKNFGSYPQAPQPEIKTTSYLSFEDLVASHREEILGNNGNGQNRQVTVAFTLIDKPGTLRDAFKPFAEKGINLRGIDSLPTGVLDIYLFYLSFDASHPQRDLAIRELHASCADLKILEPHQ